VNSRGDPDHAHVGGKNLFWRPCPPPSEPGTANPPPPPSTQGASNWSGGFGGVYFVGAFSPVKTVEETAATGVVTNQFNDCCTGFGGGLNAGYHWQLPNDVVLGGVVDAYFPNDQVSHPFAGGTYLRSTVDFTATFQARAGIAATPNLLLYAQTGLALGNQSLKVNFGGPVSRHSDTTPGYTIGAGAEWRLYDGPTGMIGQSPSLFVEYAHIFWDDAHFNTPAASPAFNYTWSRDSNVIKGGVRVRF
jgi:opacity protein-like surface antigen